MHVMPNTDRDYMRRRLDRARDNLDEDGLGTRLDGALALTCVDAVRNLLGHQLVRFGQDGPVAVPTSPDGGHWLGDIDVARLTMKVAAAVSETHGCYGDEQDPVCDGCWQSALDAVRDGLRGTKTA